MSELPKQHVGQVTYLGIDKEPMSSQAILVWSINESRIWTVQHGMHDLAKAVRDIRDTNMRWNEGMQGGLKVYSRDGDAKDERKRREEEEYLEEREAERAANPPRRRATSPVWNPSDADRE